MLVNAMGKLCPEPVIMTKAEIEKGASEIEVLVDNDIAVSNVTRIIFIIITLQKAVILIINKYILIS